MDTRGRHVICEFSGCNPDRLSSYSHVVETMYEAAKQANAHVVGQVFHRFTPVGVSGVLVIEESHLSIHTWPEEQYAAVDLYTCGDTTEPMAAVRVLLEGLQAEHAKVLEIERGKAGPLLTSEQKTIYAK